MPLDQHIHIRPHHLARGSDPRDRQLHLLALHPLLGPTQRVELHRLIAQVHRFFGRGGEGLGRLIAEERVRIELDPVGQLAAKQLVHRCPQRLALDIP